jgi:hypothetical protein
MQDRVHIPVVGRRWAARFRSGNARSLGQRDGFSNVLIMLEIFHVELASAVQGWDDRTNALRWDDDGFRNLDARERGTDWLQFSADLPIGGKCGTLLETIR